MHKKLQDRMSLKDYVWEKKNETGYFVLLSTSSPQSSNILGD